MAQQLLAKKTKPVFSSEEVAQHALDAALAKNALQPCLINVAETSSYTNYLLILSAKSTRQVEAIAEAIALAMKGYGHEILGAEGERGGQWQLLDFGDVVIHIFYHPLREYYDLEGLWADAARVPIEVPKELQHIDNF